MSNFKNKYYEEKQIFQEALKVLLWIEGSKYEGYDPFDIKGHPNLIKLQKYRYPRLGFNVISEVFPFITRRLFRVKPQKNAKAIALIALSYLNLLKITGENSYKEKAIECLNWLVENKSPNYAGYCWGYPFDWQSNVFIPKETPSIVVTAIAAEAFIKAFNMLKNEKYFQIAESTCDFILNDLNIDQINEDEICFSYTPLDNFHVHNANLFAALILHKMGTMSRNNGFIIKAGQAINYSLNQQNIDGSWYYWGRPEKKLGVIDVLHTGYVLRNLNEIYLINKSEKILNAIKKGFIYFKKNLIKNDMRPKYLHDRDYPVDIHHCAESIICFTKLNNLFKGNLKNAQKILNWCFENMYSSKGYFYYRKYPFYKCKMPFLRWGQAWMLLALTEYLLAIARKNGIK